MSIRTKPTWTSYRQTIGDRSSLFAAIVDLWDVCSALYLGSYLDLSPSTAIESVTYVDVDKRAASFFGDRALVQCELQGHTRAGAGASVEFLHQDYTAPMPLVNGSFDLLISLFTTPAWMHCQQYVTSSGLLLANASHGEASLAALDPNLELVAAVLHQSGEYRLDTAELDSYLIPRRPGQVDPDVILRSGRGIEYTRDAFAYLFSRI